MWAPEASTGDALTDKVVNLSPGYIGILATTGTEEDLIVAFTGPAFWINMEWLTTVFVHHIQVDNQKTYLLSAQKAIGATSNVFLATWANATSPPSAEWDGMIVSFRGSPSGISEESSAKLWDASVPYSLVNTKGDSTDLWFNATINHLINGSKSLSQSHPLEIRVAAQEQLQNLFGLTPTQIEMIADWLRSSFYPIVENPGLIQTYQKDDSGVQEVADLGWLQWASCGVTALGRSAASQYHFGPGGKPDYGCFIAGRLDKLTVDQSKQLLNGTRGLFNLSYVGYFFKQYGMALDPLLCPEGEQTRFNRNCKQCSGCSQEQVICSSRKNGYECTLKMEFA